MQDPPLWQRLLALLPYSLTWSDALPFGRDLFGNFPSLNALMLPAMPALLVQNLGSMGGMNLGGLLLFVLLFAAVVRNPQVPYTIRFNTLQALMLDILLVVIGLVFQLLLKQSIGSRKYGVRPVRHGPGSALALLLSFR